MVKMQPAAKGRPRGARAAANAQLSENARKLLRWLLMERDVMERGNPEEQLEVRNKGIPWDASKAAEKLGVLTASATRTLTGLEGREIICCWATGEGRGRRISHVKLSAQAIQVAAFQADFGMSQAQWKRRLSLNRAAWAAHFQAEVEMGERWERENVSEEDRQKELEETFGPKYSKT
jgi:hypothetical protein